MVSKVCIKNMEYIKGDKFVEEIIRGRKNFRGVVLEENFDLSNHKKNKELYEYLKSYNSEKNPLILDNSTLKGIRASGLLFNYVKARGANLENAQLSASYFIKSDFRGANFRRAKLLLVFFDEADLKYSNFYGACINDSSFKNSDLERSILKEASFSFSDLKGSNLKGAMFEKASFDTVDLRNVKGLESSFYLEEAYFSNSKVTEKEMEILKKRGTNILNF